MKIVKCAGLIVAEKVLKRVSKAIRRDKCNLVQPLTLQSYSNCREQGYCLIVWPYGGQSVKISISEHRSSDSIVVYCGHSHRFGTSNTPYEDSGVCASYFGADEIDKAAKDIVSVIRETLRKGSKKGVGNAKKQEERRPCRRYVSRT